MSKHKLSSKTTLISISLALLILVVSVKTWDLNSKVARLMRQDTSTETTQPSPASTPEFVEAPERNKEEKYEVLGKLSVEVQINYFIKLLGSPLYINPVEGDKDLKEHVFVDEDFYVQAITNANDKVLSYAVVSRKKDFNPTFEMPTMFSVSLNKTPFSKWLIDGNFRLCYRFLGAHDPVYYFEESYFGNPGHYLTYLVGINNSAPFEDLPREYEDDPLYIGDLGSIDCNRVDQNDRERITPNTFIVRGILLDIKEEDLKDGPGVWFGPDNIQLRTLNE